MAGQENTAPAKEIIFTETKDLSLIMTLTKDSTLEFSYFGLKITDPSPFLKKTSYRRVDYGTEKLVYPAAGGRNFKEPALSITHANGDINTDLMYISHKRVTGMSDNVQQTEIVFRDRKLPLYVYMTIRAFWKENVITQSVKIKNDEDTTVVLHNFSSGYLPIKAQKYFLSTFSGAWAKEMTMEETQLTQGMKTIQSRKGVRTTLTENPSFVLSLDKPLSENEGHVIAGALAWSGNYILNFELDEFQILSIQGGMNPYSSEYFLKKGEELITPEMIFTYSSCGAGGASRNLHDWARNYVIYNARDIRPTLLNSWEGAYFNFNEKKLLKMIDDAHSLGLEMFVLDDGWFGNKYPRNDSNAGLGDWQVNKSKIPSGIEKLTDYALKKKLKFGLWIEPEMVNPQSELAMKHPEWITGTQGRPFTTIRNQYLLDLTNPEVQNFIFNTIDNILKSSPGISYLKWDANRHAESVGSTYLPEKEQSHFWIKYTQGLYHIYENIREKYPNIIIQSCSSGGGRVDFGIMKYTQEVWVSDNTDPRSRIFIQYGTNMIYPALVSGSHVSASPNHQTNNQTPLKFRFDLAMTGRLGMELQPENMSSEDIKFSKNAILTYKQIRDIIMEGDLYRILSPYNNHGYYALSYISKNKKRAVVFGFCFEFQGRTITPLLQLNGLNPYKNYKITELNTEQPTFWGDGLIFSGQYLINEGINPKLQKCYDSIVLLLEEIDETNN
ncbi:MAG: alpha-galactosidase [Paludibacter sp.]|nr:alpha-galactosidase [Paludibacter sp.]